MKVVTSRCRVRRGEDRLFSADVGRHIAMTVVSGEVKTDCSLLM